MLVSASAWSSCASGGPSLTPAPGHLLEGGASCSISGLFQTHALQCFFLAQLGFKSELELEVCGGYGLQDAPACGDWQCHPHERAWRVRRSPGSRKQKHLNYVGLLLKVADICLGVKEPEVIREEVRSSKCQPLLGRAYHLGTFPRARSEWLRSTPWGTSPQGPLQMGSSPCHCVLGTGWHWGIPHPFDFPHCSAFPGRNLVCFRAISRAISDYKAVPILG